MMADEEMESPVAQAFLQDLQALVTEAVRYSCGDSYEGLVEDYPVSFCNTWRSSGDFQCFIAAAIFNQTIGKQNKLIAASASAATQQLEGEFKQEEKGKQIVCQQYNIFKLYQNIFS